MRKHWVLTAVMCLAITSLASADFTAYNDCIPGSVNVEGGNNPANTTTIGRNQTGVLKDFATGVDTTVSVEFVVSGMKATDGTGAVDNFTTGNDAANMFNGKVNMAGSVIYYEQADWYADLIFTGLDSSKQYVLAATHDRGTEKGYWNRWSVYTIQGTDAATYTGTVAPVGDSTTLVNLSNESVSIVASNTASGNLAQWTDIDPGDDGTFNLHVTYARDDTEWGSGGQTGLKAYAPGGFMLQEVPEPATMSLLAIGALALIRRRRKV